MSTLRFLFHDCIKILAIKVCKINFIILYIQSYVNLKFMSEEIYTQYLFYNMSCKKKPTSPTPIYG